MESGDFDNRNNHRVESFVPSTARDEQCCLGIDEAGRGPVLGPMVYGACYCPLSSKDLLTTIGFADSKTLSEEQRDELFSKLNAAGDCLGWIVNILSPNYISNSMLRRSKYNLNQLSHDTAAGLIERALEQGINIKEVYVDTVGDPAFYENKLKSIFPHLEITVSKKADSLYPIVSAASICAKVTRDKVVREWKFIEDLSWEGNEYGSGYPGDPKTKNFLTASMDSVFGFSQFVRFGWSTASVILDKSTVPVCWDDDDADIKEIKAKDGLKNVPAITSFFQSSRLESLPTIVPLSHRYFTDRCLKQVSGL